MTKKHPYSLDEQRQLLNLRADGLRLKILTTQIKKQQTHSQTSSYYDSILTLIETLPLTGLALKLSNKPKRWRNKLVVAGGLLSIIWLIQKFKLSLSSKNN